MSIDALESFQCTNHPDREGIGVCMGGGRGGCKRVFCEECSTKIEGVNTCLSCLKRTVKPGRGGPSIFARAANALFGLAAVAFGVTTLVGALYAAGMEIPEADDESQTNRLFRNNEILTAFSSAFARYRTDNQDYPNKELGFKALTWDKDELGEPPPNHSGSYWPDTYSFEIEVEDGVPLDAYGHRLRYIVDDRFPSPILLSDGPDGIPETDIEDLARRRKAKPNTPLVGGGDDLLVPVR